MRRSTLKYGLALAASGFLGLAAGQAKAITVDNIILNPGATIVVTDFVQNKPLIQNDELMAAGTIGFINGTASFCANGLGNCQLTFVANGFRVSNNPSPGAPLGFTGGEIKVFETDGGTFNSHNETSITQAIADATGSHLFLDLTGHLQNTALPNGNFTLSGTGNVAGIGNQLAFATGLLDAVGGDAGFNFDTNTQPDGNGGLGDISLNGSGSTAAVSDAQRRGGIFFTGSDNLNGNVVPEPMSLALMGSALLGMGAVRRRKKS